MAENQKDIAGVILLPPYIFLIALGAAIALQLALPLNFLHPFRTFGWQFWLGVAVSVLAIVIATWGIVEFLRHGTNVPPDKPALHLVTSGPYRFTRNPMYLGILLLLPGFALICSVEWAILVWPFLALALHYGVVKREESYMEAKFGAPYTAFLRKTRRWL